VRRTRRAAASRLLLVVAVLAVGCGPDVAAPDGGNIGSSSAPGAVVPERAPTTVRVGLGRDPVSIDPRLIADDEGELIVRALFDGLVDVAPDGSVVPAGASWTTESDGLVLRFRLREGRFHDGTAVTAQHYADALLATLDPERAPWFREDLLAHLRGAQVIDGGEERQGLPEDVLAAGGIEVLSETELVIRLDRADPFFLFRLADPVLVPLPQIALVDPERFAQQPIGNGPFRMIGPREPGAFIRLRADTAHPNPPRIDELVLQVYPDDVDRSQRWADLLAGRLQITAVPVDRRDEARELFGSPVGGRSGAGLHELPAMTLYAYGFVLDVTPFDDVAIRRAISAAIDRDALALELAAAGVEPATAILPPSAGGTSAECAHCRYDPPLATELIDGWRERQPDGVAEPRIVLTYPLGAGHVSAAERIASDIERHLGLEVRLQARDFGALVREVTAGDAALFRYGLRAPVGGRAAATSLLDAALRSDAPSNWTRWRDVATDARLATWTPDSAPTLAREIEAAALDAAVIVPLLWTRPDLVVHPSLVGFRADPTGRWWPELIRLR
jgi:oligopeptide transport system substrate-binding protein